MTESITQRYLLRMGIQAWKLRDVQVGPVDTRAVSATKAQTEAGLSDLPARFHVGAIDELELVGLETLVRGCERCALHATRTNTVFGVGNPAADWMFVGEAPGAEEDRQGIPFVGRAGQLLTAMLFALGMERDDVYIANVLKCRPPDNRDPMGEEVTQCEPYLHRQVQLVNPQIIVALGRFGAQSLLKTKRPIGKLRGQQFTYQDTGIPLVVTYHPAYLLRSPLEKRKAWDDLLFAKKIISQV